MMRFLFILFVPFMLLSSCSNLEKKRQVVSAIEQWIGKELLYPNSTIFTIQGVDTLDNAFLEEYSYTIVSYVDSIGCTSCKLQLNRWNIFMQEVDSISKKKVNLNFIFHPKNVQEIINILKVNAFKHPVWIDINDSFNKLNHLSSNMSFQTFLLDKDNKVVSIGNPIYNPQVKELYLNIIQGKQLGRENKSKHIITKVSIDRSSVSMGSFDWQEEQKSAFTLKNTGDKPLVIQDVTTSCGCTTVAYSKEPLQPGGATTLEVVYKAERPEHFDKTITLYCNTDNSPLTLKISGDAK
ncbi:hypothetical protein C801_00570 [Bacteroides uniformis dnLKV2]|uniref:DUF1573 domain-containing protein n=2 Tax=Bacteroidales TaxID=171549 RepID=R9I349_BACUN|nr:hypothetical protein C801_00570 [Bacteroides uniformis dnLKV2]